jgi:hypothetical protein
MGNSEDKNNLVNKESVPADKMLLKNGRYYCNIDRKEYKLSPFVMKTMKRIHKFSCDCDDWDLSCEIKDNKNVITNENIVN